MKAENDLKGSVRGKNDWHKRQKDFVSNGKEQLATRLGG